MEETEQSLIFDNDDFGYRFVPTQIPLLNRYILRYSFRDRVNREESKCTVSRMCVRGTWI